MQAWNWQVYRWDYWRRHGLGAFTVQINLPETAVQGTLPLDLPAHMRRAVEDAFPRWTFIPYQVEGDIPKFQRLVQLRVASRLDKKGK